MIVRDLREKKLRLYGTEQSIDKLGWALQDKMLELANAQHTITLKPEHLKMAMHGGFKAVLQAFGKENVTLNVSLSPPHITLEGRGSDAANVIRISTYSLILLVVNIETAGTGS